MTITIYTDGSCPGAPEGPGGFAAVILDGERELSRVSGHLPLTTHNRAELMGVIAGLEALDGPTKAALVLDFARACLGWADARLAASRARPAVTTKLAPAPGDRLCFANLRNVLAAAAWCDASAADGRAVRAGVDYRADERLYVGCVLPGEGWFEARHSEPCQALMQACLLAAQQMARDRPATH